MTGAGGDTGEERADGCTDGPTAGVAGPHGGCRVVAAGAPRGAAEAAVVALHGRGTTAQGVVNLLEPVHRHGVTVLAPDAERSRWLPYAADAPHEHNEPHLSSALAVVDAVVADAVDRLGLDRERVVLLGFSQGAGIAAEYAARNPGPSPVVALSGSLLGPDVDPGAYAGADGTAAGVPVFLGVGADDPYVPVARMRATADVLRALGADVTERVYEGVGHEVTDDEFAWVDDLLAGLVGD
ncbi:alpha/beta hydrolase [Haloglomus salinum]|uniref:alpha/beta hydrolase n=1 Tax=Haloglomus salinum TaxID=2962673 RepID=UPI0020C93E12|nr:alpha/beta fold hydrolase [Haloglomus salinum]